MRLVGSGGGDDVDLKSPEEEEVIDLGLRSSKAQGSKSVDCG